MKSRPLHIKNFQGSKSTLISTHYTHHENIHIRYKRWLPTIAHSIYWFSIEKPKDYHKNLMIAWEEKRTNKTNASFNYYLGAFVHSKIKEYVVYILCIISSIDLYGLDDTDYDALYAIFPILLSQFRLFHTKLPLLKEQHHMFIITIHTIHFYSPFFNSVCFKSH